MPAKRRFHISLIGAGKVGTTLATLLHRSGHKIVAVVSADKRSARKCASLVSCKTSSDDIADLPSSTDFVLIAVPDLSITGVAGAIAQIPNLDFKHLAVCHTSGVRTSDDLASLAERGATVFSLHPAQTFPEHKSVGRQIETMKGIWYGIEGPDRSLRLAKRLVKELGGKPLIIPKDAKILYHTACVIASNYAVTLVGVVDALARQFTAANLKPFGPLVQTSIANALESGAADALTGPVVRGDADTLAQHLGAIDDKDVLDVYRTMGKYALKLALANGRISAEEAEGIRRLFTESE